MPWYTSNIMPKTSSKPAQTKTKNPKLPGALRLFKQSFVILAAHWKVFVGITLLYGVLNVVLVQGFHAAGNLGEAKSSLDQAFTGNWSQLLTGASLFVYLLGASGNTATPTAGAYQFILALIVSLALIWTLRQVYAKHAVRVRDGLYLGMGPLVPFVLVLGVIVLQLLPLSIGALLYGTVVSSGIAATGLEQALWALLFFGLAVVSLYLISSSLLALYIVTLPDMTPLRALRSARQLVRGRRWTVLRKLVFLPVALFVLAAMLMIPLILFATPLAAWIFLVVTMLLLPIVHSYMYALYRSLL